eukprot:PLAT6912.1.p1 GENE.PLAT6912.1~~PLAT6912.1.p1  ORF type:complete len:220 (+),score=113.59 PLAT6912.1:82-741(+)
MAGRRPRRGGGGPLAPLRDSLREVGSMRGGEAEEKPLYPELKELPELAVLTDYDRQHIATQRMLLTSWQSLPSYLQFGRDRMDVQRFVDRVQPRAEHDQAAALQDLLLPAEYFPAELMGADEVEADGGGSGAGSGSRAGGGAGSGSGSGDERAWKRARLAAEEESRLLVKRVAEGEGMLTGMEVEDEEDEEAAGDYGEVHGEDDGDGAAAGMHSVEAVM